MWRSCAYATLKSAGVFVYYVDEIGDSVNAAFTYIITFKYLLKSYVYTYLIDHKINIRNNK